jgi:hypothetical protein
MPSHDGSAVRVDVDPDLDHRPAAPLRQRQELAGAARLLVLARTYDADQQIAHSHDLEIDVVESVVPARGIAHETVLDDVRAGEQLAGDRLLVRREVGTIRAGGRQVRIEVLRQEDALYEADLVARPCEERVAADGDLRDAAAVERPAVPAEVVR